MPMMISSFLLIYDDDNHGDEQIELIGKGNIQKIKHVNFVASDTKPSDPPYAWTYCLVRTFGISDDLTLKQNKKKKEIIQLLEIF